MLSQMEQIGENIRVRRHAAGLKSQQALANIVYCDRTIICNLEIGKRLPSVLIFKRLARYFGTTIDELIKLEEDKI